MERTTRRSRDEQKAIVKACKRYIETHLDEDITTDSLAEQFDLSSRTLWRYFKNIGKYSVSEYVRLRKVHAAARCLRHGRSVQDAQDSGFFRSKTHFVESFTEYYGVSPWQFKKSRGMELMAPPKIMNRPEFYIVGYAFQGPELIDLEECGAFYIIQDFPPVSARDWARIGGGADMVGPGCPKTTPTTTSSAPASNRFASSPKI
ncbi:MAG: AraC family transcriptional regulator [Firmicutes bacterium]|nr:AraC family transcriptional regulator [Bacillota bacterium]